MLYITIKSYKIIVDTYSDQRSAGRLVVDQMKALRLRQRTNTTNTGSHFRCHEIIDRRDTLVAGRRRGHLERRLERSGHCGQLLVLTLAQLGGGEGLKGGEGGGEWEGG